MFYSSSMKRKEPLGNPIPVRLWKEDDAQITKIAGLLQMPEQEVIRRIVAAGVTAIKERNYVVELPLRMKIEPAANRFPPRRDAITVIEDRPPKDKTK
jgi:hypothetical protein